jgi:hypothetical protein
MIRDRARLATIAVFGLLLLAGFAFGRLMVPQDTAQAFNGGSTSASPSPSSVSVESEADSFYLSDFKTGFSDGYNSASSGDVAGTVKTSRTGYNEGFKQGFSEGFSARASDSNTQTTIVRPGRERVVYRTVTQDHPVFTERRGSSKLKTALTIAAPAALGAGVGAVVGGKKGAGAGALLGGGGGALYYLIKNR